MEEHTYKIIELTGSSASSIEEAVDNAVAKAAKTLRNLRWFTIEEVRGALDGDHVGSWQVTVRIGFTLEDQDA